MKGGLVTPNIRRAGEKSWQSELGAIKSRLAANFVFIIAPGGGKANYCVVQTKKGNQKATAPEKVKKIWG